MKSGLRAVLDRWLYALLPAVSALYLLSWRLSLPFHGAAVPGILVLFTFALAALTERFARAGVWLTAAALGAIGLLCGRARLTDLLLALRRGGDHARSLTGDALLFAAALSVAAAALYLLPRFSVRLGVCLVWTALWVAAGVNGLAVPKAALSAMLPVLLLTLCESAARWKDRGGVRFRSVSAGLLAALSFSALLVFAPAPETPYGYPLIHRLADLAKAAYESVETKLFYRSVGSEQFSIAFNGLSESARLSGAGSNGEGEQEIYIRPAPEGDGIYYLAGNSWDSFDGKGWSSTVDRDLDGILDWQLDTAEHLFALWRYRRETGEGRAVDDFFRGSNAYLSYHGLHTRTIFTAPDTLRIYTDEKRYPFTESSSRVLFDYMQERDAWYRLYSLRRNEATIGELITAAEGYSYDEKSLLMWKDINADYRENFFLLLDERTGVERLLARRAEFVRSVYLTLPEDLSEEVRALAAEITASCTTDYERLTAIADYLRENYAYTTTPPAVPADQPFLDYLLFDAREGYCTWYATAATILSRAAGVPARYVQGYRAALKGGAPGMVDASDAHAWCEGYVAGYGWVTVEATPGLALEGVFWEPGQAAKRTEPLPTPAAEGEGGAPVPAEEKPERAQAGARLLPTLAALFAAALAVLGAADLLRRRAARRAYEAADYSGRAALDLRRLLALLGRRGFVRREEQSLRAYFDSVHWSNMLADEAEAKQAERLFEKALFGAEALTRGEWERVHRFTGQFRGRSWHVRSWKR